MNIEEHLTCPLLQLGELEQDAQKITKILENYSFQDALKQVTKYKFVQSYKRVQTILEEHFNAAARNVSSETLYSQGLFIQSIFPTVSNSDVLKMLRDFASEDNRVRIVIKKLLLASKNERKRPLPFEPFVSEFIKKPLLDLAVDASKPSTSTNKDKIFTNGDLVSVNTDVHNTVNSKGLHNIAIEEGQVLPTATITCQTPYLASLSTDIAKFTEVFEGFKDTTLTTHSQSQEMDSQATIIVTPESTEIPLLEDIDFAESNEDGELLGYQNKFFKQSCVKNQQSSNGFVSVNTPEELVTSTSKATEHQPLKLSICHGPTNMEQLHVWTPNVPEGLHDVKLQPLEKYNLYKHLKEMFSDISQKRIRRVCKKYVVNKFIKPSEMVFNAIVSDLLNDGSNQIDSGSDNDNLDLTTWCEHMEKSFNPFEDDAITSRDNRSLVLPQMIPLVESVSSTTVIEIVPPEVNNSPDIISIDNTHEKENSKVNEALIYPLMEMFPDACPEYIRNICVGKENDQGTMADLISVILDSDYPRRKKGDSPKHITSIHEQLEIMKQILPDADPNYLEMQCEELFENPDSFKTFITSCLEKRDYPTMKDYLRKQQLSAQQKQYTTDFSVENFLEVIPDPVTYFNDPNRKPATVSGSGLHYALYFLRNHYPKIQLTKIREVFKNNKLNFLATCKVLDYLRPNMLMKSKRSACKMPEAIQDIPLLQEIAFIQHEHEIVTHIEEKKLHDAIERDNAKSIGLLQTCNCCYDEEVMPKDIYTCENGCMFCKECVTKSIEVSFGDGRLNFPCLGDCSSNFSLQTLQAVLNPKLFSIIALKKQVEEVKAAGIEDLEVCPFCDFATIPAREDKLFRCLNPECMKESCRSCKEPSHVPFRCDEVEKEDDVKRRTYIENKMTEALLRKCYKCGLKFIKADGCNKMTCSCGAMMCYICGKAVKDYRHFNGVGGDQFQLCPLYSDTNKLHEDAVLESAEKAKQEVSADDSSKLKIDPTVDVKRHYKDQAKINPEPHIQPFVMPMVYLNPAGEIEHQPRRRHPQAYAQFIQRIQQEHNHHMQQQPHRHPPRHYH